MRQWKSFLFALGFFAAATAFADVNDSVQKAIRLRDEGQFKQAESFVAEALKNPKLSADDRKSLEWQRDLTDRIRQDFSLTEEQLFARLQKSVKNLTRAEFEDWLNEGRFESRTIDGTRFFSGTSVSNLYFRHQELAVRRNDPKDLSHYAAMLKNARAIKEAALKENSNYVLPHRFNMTMTVTADANVAPDGQTIRAWLPIPRKFPFQSDFKFSGSGPMANYIDGENRAIHIADENSAIRSVYMEQPATKDLPTKFWICYEYTRRAVYFPLKAEKIRPYNTNDATCKKFTSEAPHVVFSPEIKQLSAKIVGSETNPMRKARAIYDWMAKNIKYSYALEYSTIPNISEYCRSHSYGDCGQQALLFITLCRAQGIPARWQSGWIIFPQHKNLHDWTEIYLEPYGWVPVDVEVGGALTRYATNLSPAEQQEAHDFYFGGLDQFRMIANSDHSQKLQPPKNSFRSDDVDFQRGELETGNQNIYFDRYNYSLQIEQLSPAK